MDIGGGLHPKHAPFYASSRTDHPAHDLRSYFRSSQLLRLARLLRLIGDFSLVSISALGAVVAAPRRLLSYRTGFHLFALCATCVRALRNQYLRLALIDSLRSPWRTFPPHLFRRARGCPITRRLGHGCPRSPRTRCEAQRSAYLPNPCGRRAPGSSGAI